MIRTLPLLLVLVFSTWFLLPGTVLAADTGSGRAGWSLDLGTRTDKFLWNIAGNGAGAAPDILSELRWPDLHSLQLAARGWRTVDPPALISRPLRLQLDVAVGETRSGRFTDRDYAGDNRTLLTSEIHGRSEDGHVADVSAAVGMPWHAGDLVFIPLLGYSLHLQHLTLTDGRLVYPALAPNATDPFADDALDSRYRSRWHGPWMGLGVQMDLSERWELLGQLEYHWGKYYAEARWNLRDDFAQPVSFEHRGDARGQVLLLQLAYELNADWTWQLSGKGQRWRLNGGTDQLYLADGSSEKTRLNRVEWDSFSLNTGLAYRF